MWVWCKIFIHTPVSSPVRSSPRIKPSDWPILRKFLLYFDNVVIVDRWFEHKTILETFHSRAYVEFVYKWVWYQMDILAFIPPNFRVNNQFYQNIRQNTLQSSYYCLTTVWIHCNHYSLKMIGDNFLYLFHHSVRDEC